MYLSQDYLANTFGGTCFGVDPTVNGAFCHTFEVSENDYELKLRGNRVTWITAADFDGQTWDETVGTI